MREKEKRINATLNILENIKKEKKKYYYHIYGKRFVIYPNVFSPKYFLDTKFWISSLPINKGEKFLEIGTGIGIVSIFAAYKGAGSVIATDINPDAVRNAKENVKLHKFEKKIRVLEGDIFEPVPKSKKFDTIFWNAPFGHVKRKDISMLERSVFDPHYKSHERLFEQSKRHLEKNGRLLVGFSPSIGHLNKLRQIAKNSGFKLKILDEKIVPEFYNAKIQLYEARPK